MTRWQRIKNWFRRKDKAATAPDEPLREFVYLDDVSVDSLVASVKGGVLEQITQTTGSEVQSEHGVSIPVSTAEVRSRVQTTTSDGLQTLRRAGIQARFRELHQIVEDRRALRPRGDDSVLPEFATVADVRSLADTDAGAQWAVPVGRLRRGDIVEVDVELGTEPLFHLVSAMSQILALWPDDPGALGLDELPDLGQAQGILKMLSVMLGGLVPIRSMAIDFDVVDLDGEPWLVHHKVLEQLPSECVMNRRPLAVVGVASEDRFWKDQRRVVFAGARYRVLARLVADGTSDAWTPVKMVDTFKAFVPGFSEALGEATREGRKLLAGRWAAAELPPGPTSAGPVDGGSSARLLVETYGRMLGDRMSVTVTVDDLVEAGITAPIEGGGLPSLTDSAALLAPVTAFVADRSGTPVDLVVVSDTRLAAAQQVAHLTANPEAAAPASSPPIKWPEPALVEVEFVAVYW